MGEYVRLVPDGTVSSDDINVVNAANSSDALGRSEGDYVEMVTGTGSSEVVTELTNLDTLTNKRIARVRVRAKAKSTAGVQFRGIVREGTTDQDSFYRTGELGGDTGQTVTGHWLYEKVGLGEWTRTAINAARLKVKDDGGGASKPTIYWAEVELDIRSKPIVNIISPATGSVAGSSQAELSVVWTVSATGDPMAGYRVKVFHKTVVEGAGFNPESSTPVAWDSGEQSASFPVTTVPEGVLLDYENYYVYVKAYTLFPRADAAEKYWSEWDSVTFRTHSMPGAIPLTPNGAIANAMPLVTWLYADIDNKPARGFIVEFFERPGGSWTGFDPATATPLYRAVIKDGTATSHQTTRAVLKNLTNYRVYITAIVTVENFTVEQQAFSDFNTSFTVPATPTLTLTAQPDTNNRVKIDVLNNQNHASVRATVERSDDGGLTWAVVRGIDAQNIGFNITTTFYDYEAQPNTLTQYRAWVTSTASGAIAQSAFATGSVTLATRYAFLKDVTDATRNVHLRLQGKWLKKGHRRPRAYYEAINRDRPIPMRGVAAQRTTSVQVLCKTRAELTALLTLLNSDRVLLLQTAWTHMWVDITGDYDEDEYLWNRLRNHPENSTIVSVSFVEVEGVS
jgi:hypothetical protein